jgi:hypothetical protein
MWTISRYLSTLQVSCVFRPHCHSFNHTLIQPTNPISSSTASPCQANNETTDPPRDKIMTRWKDKKTERYRRNKTGARLSRNDIIKSNDRYLIRRHSYTNIMSSSRLGTALVRLRSNVNSSTNQIRRSIVTARPATSSKIVIGLTGLGTIAGLVSRTRRLDWYTDIHIQ